MLNPLKVCGVWFLLLLLLVSFSSSVFQVSLPEEHHLCLVCSDFNNVVWTHQDLKVIATKQGNFETNRNRKKYSMASNGSLCLEDVERSDAGRYSCNDRPVADVEVLTGRQFAVRPGRVLLIPCKNSGKRKQRWYYKREGEKREPILTRFRNGTVKCEREDPTSRFTFNHDALQILNLQPGDAGEYLCNGDMEASVTVRADEQDPTSTWTPTATSSPAAPDTDGVDGKTKRSSGNGPAVAAAAGLAVVVVLLAGICVLLIRTKCWRKRKCRARGAESWPQAEETVHYASLGRPNWRDRAHRAPPTDSDQHNVIYSLVITKTTGK